jgi:hypothetical protein
MIGLYEQGLSDARMTTKGHAKFKIATKLGTQNANIE